MKLKLNKKKMKSLSNDNKAVPADMTPQVAGGTMYSGNGCDMWEAPTGMDHPHCETNHG